MRINFKAAKNAASSGAPLELKFPLLNQKPMSKPSLSRIQFKLYVLCFDDYVADAFTTGFVDACDTRARWQAAVDTLYRLAVSGLIKSPTFSDDRENGLLLSYIDELSRVDPFPPSGLADEWIKVDVTASEATMELMTKFNVIQSKGVLSQGLNVALDELFATSGVPYEVYPVKLIESF